MSSTYYHYQGFVYGPCNDPYTNFEAIQRLPKYKWTGSPLEDWKEMIEGKDFKLDTYRPETEEDYKEAMREEATELNKPYREKQLFAYPINQ